MSTPSLRQLAQQIEALAREHLCWSQAHDVVHVLTGVLCARARIEEINQNEARPAQKLEFDYLNWRGEQARRCVNPLSIRFGTSEWYRDPTWLLMAWDIDKKDRREFAIDRMRNIKQMDRPA
jgi:predicted DNA-binding transcriptional regulator YafY